MFSTQVLILKAYAKQKWLHRFGHIHFNLSWLDIGALALVSLSVFLWLSPLVVHLFPKVHQYFMISPWLFYTWASVFAIHVLSTLTTTYFILRKEFSENAKSSDDLSNGMYLFCVFGVVPAIVLYWLAMIGLALFFYSYERVMSTLSGLWHWRDDFRAFKETHADLIEKMKVEQEKKHLQKKLKPTRVVSKKVRL